MACVRGLSALLLLTPLFVAGCVAPRVEAATVSLTFACRNHEVLHYRSLAEAFQADHPEIVIRLVSLEEIASTMPEHPAGETGRVADVVDAFAGRAPDADEAISDVLLDLTAYATREGLVAGGDLYAGAAAAFRRDGRTWGLPHQAHAYVLFYDPAAFDAAGVPAPEPGWTRDDLLRAAIATTERDGDAIVRYGFVDRRPGYTAAALAARVSEEDGAAPIVDRAELAQVLAWYADLARVYGVTPDPSTPGAVEEAEALLMGERPPAIWTGHSFEAGRFRRRYGARLAPLPQGQHPAAPISVDGYMVSARTPYPEAAWQWIEFLSRQPSAAYYGGIMARRNVAYWGELDESTASAFRYCLERGVYYGPDVWTPVHAALLDLLNGDSLGASLLNVPAGPSTEEAGDGREPSPHPRPRIGVARALALEEDHATTLIPTPEPTAIRFGLPADADDDVFRTLATLYGIEHPEIRIDIRESGARSADCYAAGASAIGGTPATHLKPLDAYLTSDRMRARYPAALLEPLRRGGRTWGLPLDLDARMLVYSRAPFDAAGRAYPNAEWTVGDLTAHVGLLANLEGNPPTYGFWPRWGPTDRAGETIGWMGGGLLDSDGRPAFDTPAALRATARYQRLLASAPPTSGEEVRAWGVYPEVVRSGRVAMWFDDYGSAREAIGGDSAFGLAALPAGTVMPRPTIVTVLYIAAETNHPETCWDWLVFLSGRPEAAALLPARADVADGATWRARAGDGAADAWLATLARLARDGDTWGPYSDAVTLGWVDRAVAEIAAGGAPEEALARAQEGAAAYATCLRATTDPAPTREECLRIAQGVGDAVEE